MTPITIGADTFTSISAAWRATSPPGLPLATVRRRLGKYGWPTEDAFLYLPVIPEDRRTFKEVRES